MVAPAADYRLFRHRSARRQRGGPCVGLPRGRWTGQASVRAAERLLAVYVPTNQLYLGNLVVCPRDRASFPDLTVEQGIRIFLTGGMALPAALRAVRDLPAPGGTVGKTP